MQMRQLWSGWLIVLLFIVILAIMAPYLTPYDPLATEPENQFLPPNYQHLLGTDHIGRDVLSRTLWGARQSLGSAALSSMIALGIGLGIGGVAGAIGGWADWLLMRGVDVVLAFPGLLLAIALIAILGSGVWQTALAVGISLAPSFSRLVRAAVSTVREELYVESARALGAGRQWIILRHLLPNITEHVTAFTTVVYAWSLLNIAALDFLGLSGSPSTATWGRMLNEGRAYLSIAPWIALGPGMLLTLSVIAVTGLSDTWRQSLPGRDQGNTKSAA